MPKISPFFDFFVIFHTFLQQLFAMKMSDYSTISMLQTIMSLHYKGYDLF